MAILIDGYNLLHVTGIFSDAVGPGSLERLHAALLDFLASALPADELPRTTVVFDAKGRRAAARREKKHGAITVHYSARHEDADTLLAELIREHNSPRSLTVVSSDHQVQRAARRRRAKAVDSNVWYRELLRARRERQQASVQAADLTHARTQWSASTPAENLGISSAPNSKPAGFENDVLFWLEQFDAELLREMETLHQVARPVRSPEDTTAPSATAPSDRAAAKDTGGDYLPLENPFPPSYLEEIAREIKNQ